jgi:hypothetical protein
MVSLTVFPTQCTVLTLRELTRNQVRNCLPGLRNGDSKAGLEIPSRSQSQERSNGSSISELRTKENLTIYRDLTFSIVENQRGPMTV